MLPFFFACATTQVIGLDTGEVDSGPGADSADTADQLPGPDPLGTPVLSPDGGTFVDAVEVSVAVEDGGGTVETCRLDPGESRCTWEAYTGPVTVQRSVVFRARVSADGVAREVGRVFTEVDAELADFSSPIPLLVFWTDDDAPDDSDDVAMGLTVLEPADGGRVGMLDATVNSGRARLHVRGSSSSGFEKKAYDLELWEADSDADRNDGLLGLPDNGDWVLYAPYYYDEALIRNPLIYTLSRGVGRYAPRHRFVEVFVAERGRAVESDDYLGVYVLLEEIEVDEERVAITPLLPEDVAEPEVTGGYLFKVDRTGEGEDGYWVGTAGGQFDFQQSFVAVQPSEADLARQQEDYLIDRLDAIGWAVADGEAYDELIDVDSFIDHHILNLVMKNPDALRLSGYLFQDREGKVQAGPLWDFDRSAGSQDSRSFDPTWWDNTNETWDCTAMFTFGWYRGLFEDPAFAERYWARFDALLASELSAEVLDATILELSADLEEPAARDAARWGQAEFTGEIAELRTWMAIRHDWMATCIATEADPRSCAGR